MKWAKQVAVAIFITVIIGAIAYYAWTLVAPVEVVPTTKPPTPTLFSGVLKGKLIGRESLRPLGGAAVILGLVSGEKKCTLKANLVTIVNEDGSFQFTEVPPGSYVIFYDPSGEAISKWKNIDGLEVSVNIEGLSPNKEAARARAELISTFGGGGKITMTKGSSLEFQGGIVTGGNGSIISHEYGLTMDYREGKPIMFEIQPGKTVEIEVKAWNM